MTWDELLDDLCFECSMNPCYALKNGDECYCMKQIRQHFDKYRWHDLRKNPNDLPALGKKVVGYFENYGTWTIGIVHRHENGWRVEEFWLEGWELLAWKEVEPFEVSE